MTNPAALIGLTYRGTDVQEPAFGIYLELRRGLSEPPTVRGTDTVIPARPGRISNARRRDRRVIELVGIVSGAVAIPPSTTWADPFIDPALIGMGTIPTPVEAAAAELATYRANALSFRALFDPRVMGPLVAIPEDGSTRLIQARTLNTVWTHENPILAWVSVELESLDPDWVIV